MGLTVAITGPTGEIGMPLLRRLERTEAVESVRGMARRPFRPEMYGWEKVAYRRGVVLVLDSRTALFAGADVAVHLAFSIFGGRGSFVGVLLGVLLLQVISNSTIFLNLSQAWQYLLVGLMALAATAAYAQVQRMTAR